MGLGACFETLPGVSVNTIALSQIDPSPQSSGRVTGRGCVSPKTPLSGSKVNGILSVFWCKEFSGDLSQFHMVADLHQAKKKRARSFLHEHF